MVRKLIVLFVATLGLVGPAPEGAVAAGSTIEDLKPCVCAAGIDFCTEWAEKWNNGKDTSPDPVRNCVIEFQRAVWADQEQADALGMTWDEYQNMSDEDLQQRARDIAAPQSGPWKFRMPGAP
jgi:hypothetical protein